MDKRTRRVLVVGAITMLALSAAVRAQQPKTGAAESVARGVSDAAAGGELASILEEVRVKFDLPAMAAAIIRKGKPVEVAVVGVRARGSETPAERNDKFHIGSCTKAMTATLCGILVERGKLSWDTTVAESFPKLVEKVNPAYRSVTLEQLLCHRSGLPEDRRPDEVFFKIMALEGPMRDRRLGLVEIVLNQEPAAAPGSKFMYSNAGFSVAGAMAEQATGKTWEELLRENLFTPLGMESAGFGAPGTAGEADQPRGHPASLAKAQPVEPGPTADNPAVIGPAGTVHCSISDWAKFGSLFVEGSDKGSAIVNAATLKKLQTDPFEQDYGFGWGLRPQPGGGGHMLTHAGSNGSWLARIALSPDRGGGFFLAINQADPKAQGAFKEATERIGEYAKN